MSNMLPHAAKLPPHEQAVYHEGGRIYRLYRFLTEHGPVHRERIIHWCGFPSPKQEPVSAYVQFHNAILRLETLLHRHGRGVSGGIDTGQIYQLVEKRT